MCEYIILENYNIDKYIYDENKPIDLWGQQHLQYLGEYKQFIYIDLLIKGRLNEYLADVNERSEHMFLLLIKEHAGRSGAIFSIANKTWQNVLTIKLGYSIIELQIKLGKRGNGHE